MQKVLRKRVLRDLKNNLFRYIALAFLIIMGMYVIVSLIGAGYTIIDNGETHDEANKIEDGQFSVFVPLSDDEISQLEDAGAEVEGMFYEDYEVMDGKTLRVFANRENIDLVECDEGNLAEADDEIVVEKRFSQVNDISVGDIIQIAGNEFKVTGIGTSPDYNALFKEMSDTVVDSKVFGTVFVTEGAYDKLNATGESVKTETYLYAFRLKGKTTCDDVKDALEDIKVDANITSFVTSDDNPRTGGAADDQQINVQAGYFFGVLLMLLFTYVISVFVVHGIEKESSVIGALYALGVKRRDLMMHYLTLPVIVTTVAGIIGFLIGISNVGIPVQMADAYAYYSIPAMDVKIPPILIVYGIVMPPLTAIVVNLSLIHI